MSEWREVELSELCDAVEYGITTSAVKDGHTGPRLLRITDIVPPRIDWLNVPSCNLTDKQASKYQLRTGDIVVARTGATVGYAKYLNEPPRSVFASYLVRFQVGEEADARYVGYVVESAAYKEYVKLTAGGAAQPNANAKRLGSFRVPLPGLKIQRRIAAVLSGFDELIQINERRIEVLEDLARSLYREWFVRFRFPGHEDVEFVDSELGSIPAGWEPRRIGDLASLLTRGISPKYADDGPWTVLNQKCIRDERVSFGPARRQERSVPEAKQVRCGDVLINSTGVGTLGRVAMYVGSEAQLTVDSHVTILRASDGGMQGWLGLHIRARQPELEALGTGSTGQTELGRKAIGDLSVAVPPHEVRVPFESLIWPLLNAVPGLVARNDRLAATRDLLLPRLVIGQLDISDVDLGDLLPADAA
jgi:type I restriction enzyme, S subunit